MMKIKLFLTDIDGVWTDGGMYYDSNGSESKKFNTSDSAGVILLRALGIPTGIISGEDTPIIRNRANKLGINILHLGIRNKLACAESIASDLGISLDEIAYIGDDLNDMELLSKAGFTATPAGAPDYVRQRAQLSLGKKGGDGAFREFAETYLKQEGLLDKALDIVLNDLSKS
jgi:3-deoxy-D-glycero-D-galacto-nononate 9-phosphatase